jgi:uroporphyrinogen-III synthase
MPGLRGRTVAILEARRSAEIARLIERQGGIPYVAPILREVPIEDDTEVRHWLDRLAAGDFGVVIFLTGVGCKALLDKADERGQLEAVHEALSRTRVVARGPKPVFVLKGQGIRIDLVAPEPNTSDELLESLTAWPLTGVRIGMQVYGGVTPFLERFRAGLQQAGALVDEVQPYRWEGPVDEMPVRELINACTAGRIDALAIFSSSQIHNLFAIAEEHNQAAALQRALADPRVLVASVGPVATQAIESHGISVNVQPEHPKMGHVVSALDSAFDSASVPLPRSATNPPD